MVDRLCALCVCAYVCAVCVCVCVRAVCVCALCVCVCALCVCVCVCVCVLCVSYSAGCLEHNASKSTEVRCLEVGLLRITGAGMGERSIRGRMRQPKSANLKDMHLLAIQ